MFDKEIMDVSDVRRYFVNQLHDQIFIRDKTGVNTIEMVGACFLANEPTIFGEVNEDYIRRELEWYRSASLNVNDIPEPIPEIWKKVSDENGFINSNYGWCIWSRSNFNQFDRVRSELINRPDSRRAIAIYTRPSMWVDYDRNGMSDFMCTNTVQYMIRDNTLYVIVNMRSNDVVFGYRNDYAWQKHVADELANDLEVDSIKIIWQVGSLHVYERHFDKVKLNNGI